MATTVTDEQIIVMLMSKGTLKDTAAGLSISERTLYEKMKTTEFKEKYKNAKLDIVRKAIYEINRQVGAAVGTVTEIMLDSSVNPAIRLQAAQTILTHSHKFTDRINYEELSLCEQKREKLLKRF